MREAMTDADWDNLPQPVGFGAWSHTDYLLATLVDGVNVLAYQQQRRYAKNPGPPPEPLPRPGVRPKVTALTPQARLFLEARRRAIVEGPTKGV